jgi:hypothetical protein
MKGTRIKRFNENSELNISDVRRSFSFTYDDLKTAYYKGFDDCNVMWNEGISDNDFDKWFDNWFKKNYV